MATTEDITFFKNLIGNNFQKYSDNVLRAISNFINISGGTDNINPNDMEFRIIRENNPYLIKNNKNTVVDKNVELFFDDAKLAKTSKIDQNCLVANKFFDGDSTDFLYRLRVIEGLSNSFNKYFNGQDKTSTINNILKTEDGSSYKESGYKDKSMSEDTIYGSIERLGDGGSKISDAEAIRKFSELITSNDFLAQLNKYRKDNNQQAFGSGDADGIIKYLFAELNRDTNAGSLGKYNILGYMDTLYDGCKNKSKLESDVAKVFTRGRI